MEQQTLLIGRLPREKVAWDTGGYPLELGSRIAETTENMSLSIFSTLENKEFYSAGKMETT